MIVSGGLALAIPSRAVQSFLARADSQRSLGVYVRPIALRPRQLAMMILELVPRGAAETASLLPGDQIVSANGMIFRFADDLQNAIDGAADGVLRLEFYRGGRERLRQVTVKLLSQPVSNAA
jgi:serine protease Do